MSRRLSLRLVTGRAGDELPERPADGDADQVLDEQSVSSEQEGASPDQPPALGVTPAAAASR
jgi:hypothetical protein